MQQPNQYQSQSPGQFQQPGQPGMQQQGQPGMQQPGAGQYQSQSPGQFQQPGQPGMQQPIAGQYQSQSHGQFQQPGQPGQQPGFQQPGQQPGFQQPNQYQSQQQFGNNNNNNPPQWQQSLSNQVSPQEYQQIQKWFYAVDTDRSGHIDVNELHQCLSMGGIKFDFNITQKVLQVFDEDRSGNIGLNEFVALHKFLQNMIESFKFFDQDNSGTLDTNELLQALHRAGYNISQHALFSALPKFDSNRSGSLTFDQYLDLCIYFGNIRKLFSFYDKFGTGRITLSFDQLIACTPYFK